MKLLIISLSNLGDALLTYPAIGALWRAQPSAEFHVLASPRTRELFEADPRVHRVWIWEKRASLIRQAGLIFRLARVRFDWVVDFRHSLIPFLIPAGRRTPLWRGQDRSGAHRAERHLALVRSLGIGAGGDAVRLPFGPEEEAWVQAQLQPGLRPVVMVPGARSHLKRWPAPRFAEVADRLIREIPAQILLVGEESERPIAQEVASAMRGRATDLVGQTSLRQLAALLARTALVITNDSAGLHAADLMGVPTVAIFGPTDERKYGPRGPRSRVARLPLICAPCERALCPYGHECMQWLPAEPVVQAALGALAG